jgi:oxygen-independent coproporphyrinogen III oxidase
MMISSELLQRFDVPGPRYTSYPTVPDWNEAVGPARHAAHLESAGQLAAPLSLYVHVPFCAERCTFCGCNVVVAKTRATADRYLDHLAIELDLVAARLGSRRTLAQVHFGGGTPTFLSEEQLFRLWAAIEARFEIAVGAEISVEIDPAVTTKSQLQLLRWLGVNRLSMGIQDFDPRVQQAIHRVQTVEETRVLVEEARSLGIGSVSFDLIYGLP